MEKPVYHVLLDGRKVGPYDRRTIVGMRVKKTLDSKSVLLGSDGTRITVADLVHQAADSDGFDASGNGRLASGGSSYSVVPGIHAARLLEVQGKGYVIPPFQDEIEVRVQTKVLRVSGRFREGLDWKEDRVKFPLQDIAHARLRGTVVDLWVRTPDKPGMQRISLDLLTPAAAGELAEGLPFAAPWPGSEPLAGRPPLAASPLNPLLWAAVVGAAVFVAVLLIWALAPRV